MIDDEDEEFSKNSADDSGKNNETNDKSDDISDPNEKPSAGFDDEILEIFRKAESGDVGQYELDLPEYSTYEEEEDLVIPADVQDPERAYALYHKKIQPLLRKYVKSAEGKKLIREQVNLFLKEGHKKGRDGKQAYYHLMEQVVVTIENWARDTHGKDLVGLYTKLIDKNKDAGYTV